MYLASSKDERFAFLLVLEPCIEFYLLEFEFLNLYSIHSLTNAKETGQYYNFSNIRYAAPPLGKLRFAEPVPPDGRNTTINDGQHGAICPQASPSWELIEGQYIFGTNLSTLATELAAQQSSLPSIPKPGPTENEDCLFLDVITPVAAYNKAKSEYKEEKGHENNLTGGQYPCSCLVS